MDKKHTGGFVTVNKDKRALVPCNIAQGRKLLAVSSIYSGAVV